MGRKLTKLVTISTKHRRRSTIREANAEEEARLEQTIEKELLTRFQSGTYGDIYNYSTKAFDLTSETCNDKEVVEHQNSTDSPIYENVQGDYMDSTEVKEVET